MGSCWAGVPCAHTCYHSPSLLALSPKTAGRLDRARRLTICVHGAAGAQGRRAAGAVTGLGVGVRRQGRAVRLTLVETRAAAAEGMEEAPTTPPAPTETRVIVITSGKVCTVTVLPNASPSSRRVRACRSTNDESTSSVLHP